MTSPQWRAARARDRAFQNQALERLVNENQRLRRQLREAMLIGRAGLDVWHDEYHDGAGVDDCPHDDSACRDWRMLRDEIAADDAARAKGEPNA